MTSHSIEREPFKRTMRAHQGDDVGIGNNNAGATVNG
jgi:hypothetical protein